MNPKEMLFELKPCDECSHSCVEGQFGVKCPYDLIVEPLLNKTKMKTQKEIEELAESEYGTEIGSIRGGNPYDLEADRKNGFIKGYTQCQEDMADKKYTEEDLRIAFDTGYYTRDSFGDRPDNMTAEDYINSLNKQD